MSLDLLVRSRSSEALSTRQWRLRQPLSPYGHRGGHFNDITSTERSEIIPFGANALIFEPPVPPWSHPLLERISELGDLQSNWDSYGARPIDPHCAVGAAEFVVNFLDHNSPTPAIVPTSRGEIQLEWHRADADLEVRINSSAKFHVWFEDKQNEHEEELELTDNLLPLLPLLERVSKGV